MDPVSRGIEILLKWFNVEMDVPFWSQHISFFLVGIIIASSIRGFLNYLMVVMIWTEFKSYVWFSSFMNTLAV